MSIFRENRIFIHEELEPKGDYPVGISESMILIENCYNDLAIFRASGNKTITNHINESFTGSSVVLESDKSIIVELIKNIFSKILSAAKAFFNNITNKILVNTRLLVAKHEKSVREKDLSKMHFKYRKIKKDNSTIGEIIADVMTASKNEYKTVQDAKDFILPILGIDLEGKEIPESDFVQTCINGVLEEEDTYAGLDSKKIDEVVEILKSGNLGKFSISVVEKTIKFSYNVQIKRARLSNLSDEEIQELKNIQLFYARIFELVKELYKIKLVEARAIFTTAMEYEEPISEDVDITLNISQPEDSSNDTEIADDIDEEVEDPDNVEDDTESEESKEVDDKEDFEESGIFHPNSKWMVNYIYESTMEEIDDLLYGIYK